MTLRACPHLLLSLLVVLGARSVVRAAEPLTFDWIYAGEGNTVADVPKTAWLADGTAILYDLRQPDTQRTFERLDPATGRRERALDMTAAVHSLESLSTATDIGRALPWPEAFSRDGRRAVFVLHGDIFVLDLAAARFSVVANSGAEEKDPQFSPDGTLLAFVRDHDLYAYEPATGRESRLTIDGSPTTLNATLSWVYWEEIFGRHDTAYWWSPDSRAIAYLQTDEAGVPVSTFVDFEPVHPRIVHQPYPKAGDRNPRVRVGVLDVRDPRTRWVSLPDGYEWLLRVTWLPGSRQLAVQTMNRAQSELRLDIAPADGAPARHVLTETDAAWVNVHDDLYFLNDGRHFLWASERDGFMHLYRYRMDGTLANQVTRGEWALSSAGGVAFWVRQGVAGIDAAGDWIYVTALKDSSVQRQLYRVHADGSGLERVTREPGTHAVVMSPDARFYFDTWSSIRTLPALRLHRADGRLEAVLAPPRPELLDAFDLRYPELLQVPAADGFPMPAQLLKPKALEPGRKYPVILRVYGGPSAPTVRDVWQQDTLVDNVLLQAGFAVFGVDNRAATGISKRLENTLLKDSPTVEVADILAGVRWLKAQPWVDPDRVGVFGWSGGGTMTLNLMTRSKEFRAGISGAPVTDWRYYDSKWAEALVKLPSDNPDVYRQTSLVARAADLHGRLMLMYGTYDDNVHPQNALAFMNALIGAGTVFDLAVYPMRKHGFTDNAAKIHREKTKLDFWRRHLQQ